MSESIVRAPMIIGQIGCHSCGRGVIQILTLCAPAFRANSLACKTLSINAGVHSGPRLVGFPAASDHKDKCTTFVFK